MSTPTPRTDALYFQRGNWANEDDLRDLARKLERELAAERARLDWLEGNAGDIPRHNSRSFIWFAHQNLRDVIDAAMKEGATS